MKVKCKLLIECESKREAMIINESLKVDNERYIFTRVKGNFIEAKAEAKEILSLLHTIDDFLSCLSVAKRTIEEMG